MPAEIIDVINELPLEGVAGTVIVAVGVFAYFTGKASVQIAKMFLSEMQETRKGFLDLVSNHLSGVEKAVNDLATSLDKSLPRKKNK